MSTCEADDCTRPAKAKGLCSTHYKRMRRWGNLEDHRATGRSICSIEGCEDIVKGHGYCNKHFQRWKKHGDPMISGRKPASLCKYEGCEEKVRGQGYCRVHYDRWRQGRPLQGRKVLKHCQMSGCWKPHHTKGLCQMHYRRWVKWDDPWFDGQHYAECSIEGCYRLKETRGWCGAHYLRWLKRGDPIAMAEGHTAPMGIDLPFEPIARWIKANTPAARAEGEPGGLAILVERAGIEDEGERDRIEKYLDRAAKRGVIDLAMADHFACQVLRLHPALVWGDDYWTAEEKAEDDNTSEAAEVEEAVAA